MSLKWLVEETVTQGLNDLQDRVSSDMEYILNQMADEATGKYEDESAPIPSLMSKKWNKYLFTTGQRDIARTVEISEGKAEIAINYSGMDIEEELGSDAKIWWEFAKGQETDPYERELERDYAYYQETGRDPIASPKNAKHQHAIEWGLLYASPKIRKEAERQWKLMLERI